MRESSNASSVTNRRSSSRRTFVDDVVPIAQSRLAEQAHARIPGRVLTLQHPAPIGIGFRQEQPHGLTERAGYMRHRGVHGHDQVQVGDEGGRVGEVLQLFASHLDLREGRQRFTISLAKLVLKAKELVPFRRRSARTRRSESIDWRRSCDPGFPTRPRQCGQRRKRRACCAIDLPARRDPPDDPR